MKDVDVNFKVGKAQDFIDTLSKYQDARRQEFRNNLGEKALNELRDYLKSRENDPVVNSFKNKRNERNRRDERDGVSVAGFYFEGFHAYRRIADRGERIIYWGRDPNGYRSSDYVVLSFNGNKPMQSFRFNNRVYECWIAECSDCIVVRVGNEELTELRRELYVFFNADGELVGHAQYPSRSFSFLGISEFGSHYLWTYEEWLHLTNLHTGMDFLTRKLPKDFYPTVADFDTELSKIRLRSYGGMELSISWEDQRDGDFKVFFDRFENEKRQLFRVQMIRDLWESHPEPNKNFARLLIPFIEKIEICELPDSNISESVTVCGFWRLCVSIYEIIADEMKVNIYKELIDGYQNPFKIAQQARDAILSAIKVCDDDTLREWIKKVIKVIETGKLDDHPYYLAPCYRYLGEAAVYFKDWKAAKCYLEKALLVDDNVGCKRMLATVMKCLD